jgi:hypothetical protein
MPEQFSIDQLFDKLLFINKVEIGLAQSENGQVNTKEQARHRNSRVVADERTDRPEKIERKHRRIEKNAYKRRC